MTIDASVVVPTYGGEAFVAETIESVLSQRLRSFELIVCDDGSQDRTAEVVRAFGDRLLFLQQANQGVSVARNAGAARASGRYIAFLDQDDRWEPELLEELVPYLDAHEDEALVYADSWVVDRAGRRHGTRANHLDYASGRVFEALLGGNFIPIETSLFRRSAFESVGGFDPRWRLLEDYDLVLRLARRWPIGFVPRVLASYRIHGTNLSHDIVGLLDEMASLLAELPVRFPDLDPAERRAVAAEEARRRGELAWQRVRRLEFAEARGELARAGSACPRGLRWKSAIASTALAALPLPIARRLLGLLPRRRLYGLPSASELSVPEPSAAERDRRTSAG